MAALAIMDINALRDALHKQPFEPFLMRLADGRSLSVPHPDFVAVSKRRVVVIDAQTEATSHIEPLLIVSLEFQGAQAGPETDGAGGP
jgi:hypothetical protein